MKYLLTIILSIFASAAMAETQDELAAIFNEDCRLLGALGKHAEGVKIDCINEILMYEIDIDGIIEPHYVSVKDLTKDSLWTDRGYFYNYVIAQKFREDYFNEFGIQIPIAGASTYYWLARPYRMYVDIGAGISGTCPGTYSGSGEKFTKFIMSEHDGSMGDNTYYNTSEEDDVTGKIIIGYFFEQLHTTTTEDCIYYADTGAFYGNHVVKGHLGEPTSITRSSFSPTVYDLIFPLKTEFLPTQP